MKNNKVVIIGDGAVGSSIAFSLLLDNFISELIIIDANKQKAEGDALDLSHGLPFTSPKEIRSGDYTDISDAHVVVISAGANQKEGETRIDLLKRNLLIFDSITKQMLPYIHKDLIVLVVTNPVDILSYYCFKKLKLPSSQVIGSGTVLDSARLKSILSDEFKIDSRNIHAYVLGEHGDSEISCFSLTSIGGLKIEDFCGECKSCRGLECPKLNKINDEVKNAAYEIINKKGATYYGVALAVKKILKAIINNTNSILTISSLNSFIKGDENKIYFSLPTIINTKGVRETLRLNYSKIENEALKTSFRKLNKIIQELKI